ncbi:DUF1893 domain-containing protein [bacterium]|nr:DUF1893 domain-containing protein [bacterium]
MPKNEMLDRLKAGGLTLLVERGGRLVFASDREGLRPLFQSILTNPEIFDGAIVADKVVGLAAAFLLIHAKAAKVVSGVISKEAEKALDEAGIEHESHQKVKRLKGGAAETLEWEQLARKTGTPARFVDGLRQQSA